MLRNSIEMSSIFARKQLLIGGLFYLVVAAVPVFAQAPVDPIKVAAVKTGSDDKPDVDEKHPLFIPLQVAYKAAETLKDIRDYECVFAKRELIGRKLIRTTMKLKFREEPFSVYLKFIDTNAGREVLFVKGQNNNNLLVREAGIKALVGVVTLSPTGNDVMAENRYPVTSIGLRLMLNTVVKQWEAEAKFGGITAQKRPDSKLPTGETCTVYEAIHNKAYPDFKFHTTRLWIDDKTGMAIGVQQLAFPGKRDSEPPLVEEYFYSNLKTNLKLSDAEFDRNNPNYSFR